MFALIATSKLFLIRKKEKSCAMKKRETIKKRENEKFFTTKIDRLTFAKKK